MFKKLVFVVVVVVALLSVAAPAAAYGGDTPDLLQTGRSVERAMKSLASASVKGWGMKAVQRATSSSPASGTRRRASSSLSRRKRNRSLAKGAPVQVPPAAQQPVSRPDVTTAP